VRSDIADRSWASVPAALLVVVALGQLTLAHTTGLSPWKGGGFGMFASLDARPFRYVRVFVEAPQRSEELAIPASLEALAASAEILPADPQLERLARGVVARERRHERPIANGRIEVWRAEYAPGSLAPRVRLLRTYPFHATP
jgi:hypothetical protein